MGESGSSTADGLFPQTQWSLICLGGREDEEAAVEALDVICRRYWRPARIFVQSLGCSEPDAEDVVQEFFSYWARPRQLAGLDSGKGRLRNYLKQALRRFYVGGMRRKNAAKRGGGRESLPLEELEEVVGEDQKDDARFDSHWAATIVDRVLEGLSAGYRSRDRADIFAALRSSLPGGGELKPYSEISVQLGMKESRIKLEVHRLRRRFGEMLKKEVLETLLDPDDLEDELRHLFRALTWNDEGGR